MKGLMGLAVAAALLASAGVAQAADRDFCRDYTDAAMHQVNAALDDDRCARWIDEDSPRWSTDRHVHWDWCRYHSTGDAWHERNERRRVLDRCRGY